jgi:hypothetical protein
MSNHVRRLRLECLEARRLLSFLTPAQVAAAYGVNQVYYGSTPANGAGQTIAILDSGDDPEIVNSSAAGFSTSDLGEFDSKYGIASPPSFSLTVTGEDGTRPLYPIVTQISENRSNTVTVTTKTAHGLSVNDWINISDTAGNYSGLFRVTAVKNSTSFSGLFYDPTPNLPTESSGVTLDNPVDAGETSLDVEWAHAMAPGAKIVLIEMSGGVGFDMLNAIPEAKTVGAEVVSMSLGWDEFSGENGSSTSQFDDGLFTEPRTAYVAATGDFSIPASYPAVSPNVLAVGATNLNLNADGSYLSEKGWSTPPAVTGASESGSTVTITTATATGLSKGNYVTISGVGPDAGPNYDGTFAVTSAPNDTTLTYTDSTKGLSPVTPQAPVGIASETEGTVYNAAEQGYTVTVKTTAPDGLAVGDTVRISGGSVYDYSGVYNVTAVKNNKEFCYVSDVGSLSESQGGTVVSALAFGYFNAWNAGGSGGGLSQYETTQPAYQQGTVTKVTQSTTNRTTPDVSFVGGGGTPVWTYDSYPADDQGGPGPGGGTSLSTPCWAGLIADVDQGLAIRGSSPYSTVSTVQSYVPYPYQLQTALYDAPLADFHDITSGYNGASAGPGYDLVTGIGSPVANLLVPDLAGTSIDYTVPSDGASHQLRLYRDGSVVCLTDNGNLCTNPMLTSWLSDVNITDPTNSNNSLAVDYSADGIFAAQVNFDHTAPEGYDTVTVDSPNGAPNTTTLSENPDVADEANITVDGATQTINMQQVEEVDLNGGSGGDTFTLRGHGGSSGLVYVYITGGAGNDLLTVDSSKGLFATPAGYSTGIFFDGGGGLNRLALTQSGGSTQTSDTYSVGPDVGQGSDVIVGGAGLAQNVYFRGVAVTFDTVPATTLTVDAGTAANTVNYAEGSDDLADYTANPRMLNTAWGEVGVDNQPPIEFIHQDNLVIDGVAGSDQVNLNNPHTPYGLTAIAVNGADPTASDTLIANAATVGDNIDFAPTAADAGTITGAGPVPISFATVDNVIIHGQGEADNLTVTTPGATPMLVTVTPGALEDEGQVSISNPQGEGGPTLAGCSFTNLGGTGSLSIADASGEQVDTLAIDGTDASTKFQVSSAGYVNLTTFGNGDSSLVLVKALGVATLYLYGSSNNDLFSVEGNINFSGGVHLEGSGPANSDTVDLSGAQYPVAVNLGESTGPNVTAIGGYGPIGSTPGTTVYVYLSDIAVANLALAGKPLAVNGTAEGDNVITYTPTGTHGGSFALAGLGTVFNFTAGTGTAAGFTINSAIGGGYGGLANQVIVQGTSAPNLFEIDQGARTVQVLPYDSPAKELQPVTVGTDIQTLTAESPQGEDSFQVIPAAGIPAYPGDTTGTGNLLINVEGGGSAASNSLAFGSSFVTAGTMGALPPGETVVVNPGLTPDSGTVQVFNGSTQFPEITYQNVGTVTPQGSAPRVRASGVPGFTSAGGGPGGNAASLSNASTAATDYALSVFDFGSVAAR